MQTWLVVDDEVADSFILKRALKENNMAVQLKFFNGGKALLDYIDGGTPERFDLVLVDINMPEADGFDVLDQLKTRIADRAVPLVMYSNTKNNQDSLMAFERGASGFVSKPSSFFEAKTIVMVLNTMALQQG